MLVPLQTLPGWPVAPTVSWLHAIGLLIGLPLVVIIVISTIGKIGAKVSADRGAGVEDRFALQAGGSAAPAGAELTGSAAGETGQAGELPGSGGASARW